MMTHSLVDQKRLYSTTYGILWSSGPVFAIPKAYVFRFQQLATNYLAFQFQIVSSKDKEYISL